MIPSFGLEVPKVFSQLAVPTSFWNLAIRLISRRAPQGR